jgi:membrane protein
VNPGTGSAFSTPLSSRDRSEIASGRTRAIQFAKRALSTSKYLMQTEVHTFAFSVAANGILSFFPFIALMLTLTRNVFHSTAMYNVVIQLLRDHLPAGQEFVIRNLTAMVAARRGIKIASLVVLLITSTGVFLPLEVALNRVWKIDKNRSYLGNQLIALILAFGCGALALFSVALTAGNQLLLEAVFFGSQNIVLRALAYTIMKIFAVIASIAIFFLIYWILPNGKIKTNAVLPAAVVTGLLWEAGKYAYIRALPWLDFEQMYGPFAISVTLMFWGFLSGLLLLAGAHLSADTSRVAR